MRIITVLGARPQFVKAAVVSRAIARYNETAADGIEEKIVHTGQHYDDNMSKIFFDEMRLPAPAYRLEVAGQGHGAMTGQMLIEVEELLLEERPDWVLVYGDTNSTLAGALAAGKLGIPVAHVEAGLRSFNRDMPEELNRILVDKVAHLLLCPTQTAVDNLVREGTTPPTQRMVNIGDVMYDASLFYDKLAPKVPASLAGTDIETFVLCTLHRAENTDNPARLRAIATVLGRIAEETPVVLPLHPRTRKCLNEKRIRLSPSIHTVDPVGYLEMIALLRTCSAVLTDSGGLQKEAYFFKKNCVTMRDETEWVELIEAGCNVIAGADPDAIHAGYRNCINTPFTAPAGIYGDGKAGDKVVSNMVGA